MTGHVLIAGASGVIGQAAVAAFAARGWQVTALSRRRPAVEAEYRHLAVDLTDPAASREALEALPPVTHIVYAALFEEPDLVKGWQSQSQMDTNLAMLRAVIEPLADRGDRPHVSLFQGTKAYGVHIRPFPVPARESWPRHDHANFYWLQEDYLRAKAAGCRNGLQPCDADTHDEDFRGADRASRRHHHRKGAAIFGGCV